MIITVHGICSFVETLNCLVNVNFATYSSTSPSRSSLKSLDMDIEFVSYWRVSKMNTRLEHKTLFSVSWLLIIWLMKWIVCIPDDHTNEFCWCCIEYSLYCTSGCRIVPLQLDLRFKITHENKMVSTHMI